MRLPYQNSILAASILAGGVVTLTAGSASAADFYLAAQAFDATMPDTTVVRMWGFASCNQDFSTCSPPTSPGPALKIPDNEPTPVTLNITLRNDLTDPVSLVIPTQYSALAPSKFTDSLGRLRTRAFTTETAAGATGVYTWNNFRPGTFLYESGSQPQVQVQMGLLGAVTYNAAPGQAYPGVPYDLDILLVYSQVDPALHAAVRDGTYGTPGYPNTFLYSPTYFLVNGAPYASGQQPISAGTATQRVLLRMINAGLTHMAPQVLGSYLSLVAEDGQPYPFPRQQYGLSLPAGNTEDAVFIASQEGTYPIYDRFLSLTSNEVTGGGWYSFLSVGAAVPNPVAHKLTSSNKLNGLSPISGNDLHRWTSNPGPKVRKDLWK